MVLLFYQFVSSSEFCLNTSHELGHDDAVVLLMVGLLFYLRLGCCSIVDVLELFCYGKMIKGPREMMVLLFH
jgi:hypothetical protein